jgi:hypothetical protein
MGQEGFGSELWKNVQSVQFGERGEIIAPVRADGHDGIVVGVDQVAAVDAARAEVKPRASKGRFARWRARHSSR